MSSHRRTALGSAIALALVMNAVAFDAAAQTAPDNPQDVASLGTIVVTGTRAKNRTELDTASPIDVLTADDLRRAAGPNGMLGDALQTLLPSFNFPHQSNSGTADGIQSAQLRGMSPDQVLVLINGKRRHTTSTVNLEAAIGNGTTPVDFNSIPVNAIKRIEVLRDGAGAQYGSDAIAGVINIILDNTPTGGEVTASYGENHTHFAPTDRTITDGRTTDLQAKYGFKLGSDGGFLRIGTTYSHRDATNRAGLDEVPFFEPQTPPNLAVQGQRNYVAGDPQTENTNLWFNSELPLSGTATAYAFGTFNRRNVIGDAYFRYPDDPDTITAIYPDGYRPQTTIKNQDVSLAAGVRGLLDGTWSYDASVVYGRNNIDYGVRNSLNASLGANSPTKFHLGDFSADQTTANLDLSRPFDVAGLANGVNLAFGGEFRDERYATAPGDLASYEAGPNTAANSGAQAGPGLQPGDAVDTSRRVYGTYADLSSDLTDKLFVELAGRYDHYSDFGSAVTGKLSARYAFTPQFAMRGSVSNNFRAPSLAQESYSFTVTDYGNGGALAQVLTTPANGAIAHALGAHNLRPEKARNLSLGFTAQPLDALDMSLDFYQIMVDKRIVLSERLSGDGLAALLQNQFGITNVQGVNFFTNAVNTRTRGVDLVMSWHHELAGGDFKLTEASSYNTTKVRSVAPTPPEILALGAGASLFGVQAENILTSAAPRRRDVLTANWADSRWSLLGRVTRHGTTTRVFDFGGGFTPMQTYAARWQLDAEVEYKATPQLSVAVGGQNLTNQYPTRSIADISYFGNFPYDVLSPIGMNGAYYYARMRYTF